MKKTKSGGKNPSRARSITSAMRMFIVAALVACQPAQNDGSPKEGVAAFYDGRVIRWIIPYSPGGGYDEYGRMIAPYLEKYTGARVDIVNLPGAGGMRGVNELFHSPNDGLTIGMMNGSALVTNEVAGMRGADYRIGEFEYLGRVVADARVFVITLESGYASFEEFWKLGEAVKIGATGLGGSTYVDAVIVNEALEMDLDIIHGFDSSSVVRQAMLRGNIVGTWGSWGSALDSVDQGRDKVVLQSGNERAADLSDVPTAFEMAEKLDDSERAIAILSAWESLHAVGRPVAAPPGTDADKVQFLSAALDNALNDSKLLEVASKSGRPINHASAEEMRRIVDGAMVMPDDIRDLFVRAIRGEL
ncbi:MAG: Bug family tripartite tricarboxylate transporter substrate binding protein [Woeseiaceae bacterium]